MFVLAGQVIGTGEASVRTDLMNFSFEDLAAAASQLEFPFKRSESPCCGPCNKNFLQFNMLVLSCLA